MNNARIDKHVLCVYASVYMKYTRTRGKVWLSLFVLKGRGGVICETGDCDCKSRNWKHDFE